MDLLRAKRQYVTAYKAFCEATPTQDKVTLYIMDFKGAQSDASNDDSQYNKEEDQDSDQAI